MRVVGNSPSLGGWVERSAHVIQQKGRNLAEFWDLTDI